MSHENITNKIGFIPQMPICNKNTTLELTSDFSLPDYQPEIRRLLSTRVNILPPSEYIGQDSVEFSGEVNYNILYVGADGELYRATLTDTYGFAVPFDEKNEPVSQDDICVFESSSPESLTTRVLAPRKLNVRLKLCCGVKTYSPETFAVRENGANEENCRQNLFGEAPCRVAIPFKSEPIILSDFINLDNAENSIRVVDYDTKVLMSEAQAADGQLNCRGEVWLKLLYCNDSEDKQILTLNKKIPFSCPVIEPRIDAGFDCLCEGFVSDERLEIEENGIDCEFTVLVCGKAQKNEVFSYVADSYSTNRSSECAYTSLTLTRLLKCASGNITQNDVIPLSKLQAPSNIKVIDINGNAKVQELALENGKASVKGECFYTILYCKENEYGTSEYVLPFKYDFDTRSLGEIKEPLWECNVCVISSKCRGDENNLYIDSELSVCAELCEKGSIRVLSEISFGDVIEKEKSELVICYPEKNESVWSVAKRYNEGLERIKLKNNIPEGESLVKKKFLVI